MYKRKQDPQQSQEPWKAVFSDAYQAFKENNFKDSAVLFTRALSLKPGHVTILDCRAACYEKLNELEPALRDAYSIISAAPTEARGYLRVGKLLMLQKKFKHAVNVYKRALTKVDLSDSRYAQIQSMKNAAEKIVTPPASLDFMQVLPYDVVSLIFSYLSFDRRIQCTGVCQGWRQFALNWSGMWRDLDFGNRKVSITTIKKYLSYAKNRHVRRFALMDANQTMMKRCLQALIDHDCQYIECLDFVRCEIPMTLWTRMLRLVGKHVRNIRLDESTLEISRLFEEMIPNMPQLTQISMIGLEIDTMDAWLQSRGGTSTVLNLTHLRLSLNSAEAAAWVIKHCPRLQMLDFYTPNVALSDLTLRLTNTDMMHLKEFYYTVGSGFQRNTQWQSHFSDMNQNQGLTTLSIHGDLSLTGELLEQMVRKYHTTLTHLTISDCRSLDNRLAQLVIAPGLPQVQTLNINMYISLEEWDLHTIISSCPTIENLSMTWIQGVTDSVLRDVQTTTKKLKKLDISNCNNVTGVGLQYIVKAHQSTIEKLVLNNCHRIGPDAISWAASVLEKHVIECKYNIMR
ncbi:F-box/TPR repeat protein pof3 [Choanephora cucurbitarum]|uniref:F-box/TPR repeat protein pof3 n=1 Tax=Choanephora cucurbitarum TaxID=101091 RepID=A0A1C7NG64_9FUNG|nr:F-box/TPR repeat protein pof3 [Choanephora cucurbitarum]